VLPSPGRIGTVQAMPYVRPERMALAIRLPSYPLSRLVRRVPRRANMQVSSLCKYRVPARLHRRTPVRHRAHPHRMWITVLTPSGSRRSWPTVWPHATCVSVTAQNCFDVSTSARPFTRPVALHRGAAAGAFILRLCAFLLGLCAFFLGLVDCLAGPRPECNMCTASTPCCSRPASALDRVDGSPPPSLPSPTPSSSGCACNAGRPVASGPADGARLLRRDAAALGRWADHRARGSFPTKGCGKGRAPGSEAARQAWRTFVFVCPQCAALVNRARALQQARRAGRPALVDGDGCASAHCSSDYRRLRFARSQRQVAAELSFGLRSLVRPPRAADERDVWALPDRAAQAAAAAALKRLPS
jgi:hypothetical protein